MKLQDKETLSIADAVSDVLKNKIVKEVSYPHKMWSPDGEEVTIMNKDDHDKYTKMKWSHTKPVKEVDEPKQPSIKNGPGTGEKDFAAKHKAKKSGAAESGKVVKEETITEMTIKSSILKNADWDGSRDRKENPDKLTIQQFIRREAKKYNLKVKFEKNKGNMQGQSSDLAIFDGSTKDLMDYFNEYYDARMKSVSDLKAFGESLELEGKKFKWKFTTNEELSAGQKKLPPALQKAILKKQGKKEEVEEVEEVYLSGSVLRKAQKIVNDPKTKGGNMTQNIKDLEKWKKGSSDHKKVADMLQVAHESIEVDESEKQKKYQAFFKKALKKFGASSPADLDDDKKKKFFDYVDANYDSKAE